MTEDWDHAGTTVHAIGVFSASTLLRPVAKSKASLVSHASRTTESQVVALAEDGARRATFQVQIRRGALLPVERLRRMPPPEASAS